MTASSLRFILGVSGASGSVIARALLRRLVASPRVDEVHLVLSDAARRVAHDELDTEGTAADIARAWLEGQERRAEVVIHPVRDIGAAMASGSFRHDGMIIAPCSTSTAASIAHGVGSNLLHRAADVTLKERRKLIVMPRETPLSLIQLRSLVTLSEAGAIVMPLCPPFYHRPQTLDDLVDDTILRPLDHLGLPELVPRRWTGVNPPGTART